MDKLTAIKIKYEDGTYSDEIPVSVLSENVEWDSTHTLVDVLGSIDVDITGTIQDQISQLFNGKVSNSDMQAYVTNSMPAYITSWLNTNVNPVGSAVVVDSSLTVSGAAADAKVVGDKVADIDDLDDDLDNLKNALVDTRSRVFKSETEKDAASIVLDTGMGISFQTPVLYFRVPANIPFTYKVKWGAGISKVSGVYETDINGQHSTLKYSPVNGQEYTATFDTETAFFSLFVDRLDVTAKDTVTLTVFYAVEHEDSIEEQVDENTENIDNLNSALIDGDVPIDKQVNWINAYIDLTGTVRASSLSRAAVVPMRAGERVQIGTTNTNITIVGKTDNTSIAVGDIITPIFRTSSVSQFDSFEYTAKEDLNITLCVNWSDYSLKFFGSRYAKTEISKMRSEVFAGKAILLSTSYYGITAGSGLFMQTTEMTVDFQEGTKYKFILNDPSGCISKYYFYLNGSSDYQPYLPNTEYIQRTSGTVTTIAFYVDEKSTVANGEISFELYKFVENPESIEARVDSALIAVDNISDYVPTGISDGYVVGRVVTNGSFIGSGVLTTKAPNRIRTSMIPIRAGDKIVIENGGFQHSCGMWEGEPSIQTNRRNDSQFITVDETIVAEYDGYLVIVFRLSSDVNIIPSDFDGAIKLYNTFAYHLSTESESVQLPSYYKANNYISEKAARINTLGESADDVFFFITDVHWERNAKHSPALIKYLSHNCKIARLFDGGDLANGVIPRAIKAYKDNYDGKIYRLCGNHDWFPPEDGKSLYYWLNSDNYDQIGEPFKHYWYVDNVQQKIRYITLNSFTHSGDTTASGWEYGFDANQIAWFTNEALNVPAGYDVIVFAHWFRDKQGGYTGYTDIESAIASFNADTSTHGKVICIFQGHAHWDAIFHTSSGVPVITTTCDKYDISNEPELSEEVRTLGTINEQAFEVCILNREAKTITCVRIGALAQNNIDVGRTDTGFTFAQTLEERVVSYE